MQLAAPKASPGGGELGDVWHGLANACGGTRAAQPEGTPQPEGTSGRRGDLLHQTVAGCFNTASGDVRAFPRAKAVQERGVYKVLQVQGVAGVRRSMQGVAGA